MYTTNFRILYIKWAVYLKSNLTNLNAWSSVCSQCATQCPKPNNEHTHTHTTLSIKLCHIWESFQTAHCADIVGPSSHKVVNILYSISHHRLENDWKFTFYMTFLFSFSFAAIPQSILFVAQMQSLNYMHLLIIHCNRLWSFQMSLHIHENAWINNQIAILQRDKSDFHRFWW